VVEFTYRRHGVRRQHNITAKREAQSLNPNTWVLNVVRTKVDYLRRRHFYLSEVPTHPVKSQQSLSLSFFYSHKINAHILFYYYYDERRILFRSFILFYEYFLYICLFFEWTVLMWHFCFTRLPICCSAPNMDGVTISCAHRRWRVCVVWYGSAANYDKYREERDSRNGGSIVCEWLLHDSKGSSPLHPCILYMCSIVAKSPYPYKPKP